MSVQDIRAAFDAPEQVAGAGDQAGEFDHAGDAPPPIDFEEEETPPEARAWEFPLNDYGNGLRLLEYYGTDVIFVPRLGWSRWCGTHWRPDEDEIAVRADAHKIAAHIEAEAAYITLPERDREALELWHQTRKDLADLENLKERDEAQTARLKELRAIEAAGRAAKAILSSAVKAHMSHARQAGNTSKINNMLVEARVRVAVEISAFNQNPLMVNCENGVLLFSKEIDEEAATWGQTVENWRVDILPHDRRQMINKMARAPYDPKAPRATFCNFLETVQPDPEMREFLQRWFGYCLTGLTVEQKLAFLYGGGRNGKSTLVDIIAKILADYGTTVPIETLTGTEQRKGSDATPDLVRLPGARFVRSSEPEQGQRMKEALIKTLTGGEAIMIRRMQQEFVEVTPEFKLTISGNHKPDIRGGDDGIWRRILLVPFLVQIPDDQVDPLLNRKLWEERSGIFAWLVEGCLKYLESGLMVPADVVEATEKYRTESDWYRNFLLNECEITGIATDWERKRDVVDAFNAWRLAIGEDTFTKRRVSQGLKEHSEQPQEKGGRTYKEHKRSDVGFSGLRLKQEALDRIAIYGEELRRGGRG